MTHTGAIDQHAKIAIVGAGPAGLSTAWFLRKHKFRNVTVLEKAGQIGGLCKSITVDGLSYDLGANYVTWAYRETLKIANELGATTYAEKPYTSIDITQDGKHFHYRSVTDAVLVNPYTGQPISRLAFLWAGIRYLWIRWWNLSGIIDAPDYLDTIDQHPELCVSFKDWLEANDLIALATMFQFPITIMGYGQLENIAAPYALRYMAFRTVFPIVFSWLCILRCIIGAWPRRFTYGFQRLWEQVSWRTNVRLNVKVTKIARSSNGVDIDMEYPEQDLDKTRIVKDTKHYDYLVLACPLTKDVFHQLGLAPNAAEKRVNDEIQINPYCMTTFWIDMTPQMAAPVAPVLPLTKQGTPWAVARRYQDSGSLFTQFYTRPTTEQDRDGVIAQVESLTRLLGGTIDESRWHTYDKFTYFQHFTVEQIRNGIYTHLAGMQGRDRTFYVGGATDFELVEPIVVHSKHIVKKHFVGAS